ncbi:hypothetical protein BpHYR1_003255 [Brachionus plicatilis]|uniref:Uncharacterized protein n=1 Tax=Brachionus plicatilis TaxID=10195 RepID=A0A3M7Q8M8_BRAPC|nr:hypothetical protein BpHYR1_003255 [Brachionus plicatilis]
MGKFFCGCRWRHESRAGEQIELLFEHLLLVLDQLVLVSGALVEHSVVRRRVHVLVVAQLEQIGDVFLVVTLVLLLLQEIPCQRGIGLVAELKVGLVCEHVRLGN